MYPKTVPRSNSKTIIQLIVDESNHELKHGVKAGVEFFSNASSAYRQPLQHDRETKDKASLFEYHIKDKVIITNQILYTNCIEPIGDKFVYTKYTSYQSMPVPVTI